MKPASKVRVRIAPSPTGYLHIGTAHTALFNWLYARQNNGKIILRIEDTDLERSEKKYETDIIEQLSWLGLNWDEGPFKQSDRAEIYKKYILQLIEKKAIYRCFCTKEELAAKREAQIANGLSPKYDGKCRDQKIVSNADFVLRLRTPDSQITFKDLVRGSITFDASLIGDIVIAKNETTPLYHLAVVIDDYEMAVSHVIRGDDHIANTPKQIIIQEALGLPRPQYGHLPLILDPSRAKMSKRYSATSIAEYRQQGYLPETINNFLLLLGWHPKIDDKEIFSIAEAIEAFELDRVQKAGAIFNIQKLDWLNAQHLNQLPLKEIANRLNIEPNVKNLAVLSIVKPRMKKLSDFKELSDYFYHLPDYDKDLLIWKQSDKTATLKQLENIIKISPEFSQEKIMALANRDGKGNVLWPLRVALSGHKDSSGPFEIISAIGPEESLRRVNLAIKKLTSY